MIRRPGFALLLCLSAFACTSGGGGGGDDDDDDDDDDGVSVTSVLVTDGGTPVEGLNVTIHDASGSVLEHVVTDASGGVDIDVPAGGSFAVYCEDKCLTNGAASARDVIHVLDPAPGSQWSLAIPSGSGSFSDSGFVDVTVSPVPVDATGSIVYTPCTVGFSNFGFQHTGVQALCEDGATTVPQILALAVDGGQVVKGWGMATDVAVVIEPFPSNAADVTIDASNTDLENVSFSWQEIPTDHRSYTDLRLSTDHFQWFIDVNNYGPGPTTNTIGTVAPAGITTRARLQYLVRTDNDAGTPGDVFGANVWASSAAAVNGSASVATFPLARVALGMPDLAAPARPSITWTRATGAIGEVAYLDVEARNADDAYIGHRVIFVPGTHSSLTVPAVPDALSLWRPAAVDELELRFEEFGDVADRFSTSVSTETPEGTHRYAAGTFFAAP